MAIAGLTRRQIVADLFPEFLSRRSLPFIPKIDADASELGLSRAALLLLSGSLPLWEDGVMTRARSRWRSPYVSNEEPRERGWRELVQGGLAAEAPDGWRITARGMEVAHAYQRTFRAHLRDLPVPAEPTRRAAAEITRLASRLPADAERALLVRKLPQPEPHEQASAVVDLNRGVNELWGFRDDCHIAAWQAAGYDGPTVDILSQVWSSPGDLAWARIGGRPSVQEVLKALGTKQLSAEVDRRIEALIRRGDLTREDDALSITAQGQRSRDAIEAETDRRYFAIWDLDDTTTARLGDDLRAVIDALPKE